MSMVEAMDWLRRIERDRARYLRFVRARVASEADAEDVLQRALLRAVGRAATLADARVAEAWFLTIVRHAIVDHHRSRSRDGARASDEDVETATAPEPPRPACPGGVHLMAELPRAQAEILRRVDAEDEPVDAVARSLAITVGNAYVRLHRARRSLRARIEEHCGVHTIREALNCSCACC